MILKLTSICGQNLPILINTDNISSVAVGWHGAANGGVPLGRIWLKGNTSRSPDFMVEETVEQINAMINGGDERKKAIAAFLKGAREFSVQAGSSGSVYSVGRALYNLAGVLQVMTGTMPADMEKEG